MPRIQLSQAVNKLLKATGPKDTEIDRVGHDNPESDASDKWSSLAEDNAIHAAAASLSSNPFVKFPTQIYKYLNGQESTLLDAGCGYGRISIPLLEQYSELTILGLDASPVMLSKFQELARSAGVEKRVTLANAEIANLPIQDESLDCVISCAVLLHLPRSDTEQALREFHRVLKPGGKLILIGSFLNAVNLAGLQNVIYEALRVEKNANGPVRAYRRGQVEKLFQEWSALEFIPAPMVLLPETIAKRRLPLQRGIKGSNKLLTKHWQNWFAGSGFLCTHHDLSATK